MMPRGTIAILAAVFLAAPFAGAHERSESYSHWYLSANDVSGVVTIPLREVMLLYQVGDSSVPPRDLFREHLENNTAVFANESTCNLDRSNVLQAASGFVRVELRYSCPSTAPTTIEYRALFELAPGHVHYAKLYRDNDYIAEALITDANDTWNITPSEQRLRSGSFGAYLAVGVQHIGTGYDHIAFLAGLLLIAGTLGRSVVAVTGFTLGHSVSLAAAVLGYVHAESQLVEAFIGFTVALVGIEYFLRDRKSVTAMILATVVLTWSVGLGAMALDLISMRAMPAFIGFGVFAACYLLASHRLSLSKDARATGLLLAATTCFGLVHGFGFAGFLMETGILGGSLFLPLLGFNIGVEIGQLMIVAIVLSVASLVGRHLPRITPVLVAAGLCGSGLYWFVGRTLS